MMGSLEQYIEKDEITEENLIYLSNLSKTFVKNFSMLFHSGMKLKILSFKQNQFYFKVKDIAIILGIANNKKSLNNYIDSIDDKYKYTLVDLYYQYHVCVKKNPYKNNSIYISSDGLIDILQKNLTNNHTIIIQNLLKTFDLKLNICSEKQKYLYLIINSFLKLKYKFQLQIDIYTIDLYFTELKLAIECVENDTSYEQSYYQEKDNNLKELLNCTIIKFNFNQKNFNIEDILNKISEDIKKKKLLKLL